jgi:hypothetical protein
VRLIIELGPRDKARELSLPIASATSRQSLVDVRRFSPGERIVFLPYTAATYAKTQAWMRERGLFKGPAPAVDCAACVAA